MLLIFQRYSHLSCDWLEQLPGHPAPTGKFSGLSGMPGMQENCCLWQGVNIKEGIEFWSPWKVIMVIFGHRQREETIIGWISDISVYLGCKAFLILLIAHRSWIHLVFCGGHPLSSMQVKDSRFKSSHGIAARKLRLIELFAARHPKGCT